MTPERVWHTPWRITNEVRRVIAYPYIRLFLMAHGIRWGRRWRIFGRPIVQRYLGSQISFGDGVELRSWRSSNPLTPNHPVVFATRSPHARIRLGIDCGLTGARIVAASSIEIGDRVRVGSNATIVDTDFHPPPGPGIDRRSMGPSAPVIIGDDVFIGAEAIVLKGSRIGSGSVVGAGAVVAGDFPSGSVLVGNPARPVGSAG